MTCEIVPVYPGYPGYRGVLPGLLGRGDTACLSDLLAIQPTFDREEVDAQNQSLAAKLGIVGEMADWTWEAWSLVGANRGLGDICYFCILMDPGIMPSGPPDTTDDFADSSLTIRTGMLNYRGAGGTDVPDPELVLSTFKDYDWGRVVAFLLASAAFPSRADLPFILGSIEWPKHFDPNVLMCRVAGLGGYSPSSQLMNEIDQTWLVTLGVLASGLLAGTNSGSVFAAAFAKSAINGWWLGDMNQGFGEWLERTGAFGCA
jgi:hypothetical protein